jgi:hypothetical protein
MPIAQVMFGIFLAPGYPPRSWIEVLRTASTNAFALFGVLVLLIGLVLLTRARAWAKGVGAISAVAGAVLVVLVLRDIKAEIPLRRVVEQNHSISN